MKIRDEYSKQGVKNFYQFNKDNYINPHINSIHKSLDWILAKININDYLDLACGNGEVSEYLIKKGFNNCKGCDPYFKEIYIKKHKSLCYDLTFEQIVTNGLPNFFDTIICSYAIHLCPKSYFKTLLYQLSLKCNNLVIISPSKYPKIEDFFELKDSIIIDRTHVRIFTSIL